MNLVQLPPAGSIGAASVFALFGALVGSYLNVVVYRLPRGLSTAWPASHCPSCRQPIRPWHNVPVFGWLWLRGRCPDCGERISLRYPVAEALVAGLFFLCWLWSSSRVEAVAAAALASLLVVLAQLDWEHRILPLILTLPAAGLALAVQPWLPWATWRGALAGLAVALGVWIAARAWRRARGGEGLADGDPALIAVLGAALGGLTVVKLSVVAFVGTLAVWAARRVTGASDAPSAAIPLGTPLSIVGLLALLLELRGAIG
ncbi:MAG: prepilin peptidase [Acidobacteriota bacterium]